MASIAFSAPAARLIDRFAEGSGEEFMNILVVDDEPLDRELLRTKLEAEGCDVMEAADGLQALKLLGNTCVDAVVSDLFMPHMDGYRLCLEIKRDPRLQVIPSSFAATPTRRRTTSNFARKLGADKYLLKPVSPDAVFEAVRNIQSNPVRRQPAHSSRNETGNDDALQRAPSFQVGTAAFTTSPADRRIAGLPGTAPRAGRATSRPHARTKPSALLAKCTTAWARRSRR